MPAADGGGRPRVHTEHDPGSDHAPGKVEQSGGLGGPAELPSEGRPGEQPEDVQQNPPHDRLAGAHQRRPL